MAGTPVAIPLQTDLKCKGSSMKKLMLITALSLGVFSINAFAEKVSLQFNNVLVGVHQTATGMERIYIEPLADGTVRVSMGRVVPQVVEATVIKDSRPTDGPLSLKLGAVGNLIVGSGFTPDGTQSFALMLGSESIELKPLVYLNIK
jgi:hypothetical protein